MATSKETDGNEAEFGNPIKIRDVQKEIHRNLRQKKRACILSEKRECLPEVKKSLSYVKNEEMTMLGSDLIKSKDQLNILQRIRNGSMYGESQIEAFLRVPGALSKLITNLSGKNAELQLESATCITNLATGSHKSTLKVAKASAAYLITHMQGGSHFLQAQCAWAAGNIANDCEKCLNELLMQNIMQVLHILLASTYPEVVESALFAFAACTKYTRLDLKEMIHDKLLFSLVVVLSRKDISHEALVDAMFTLWNISLRAVQNLPESEFQKIVVVVLSHLDGSVTNHNIDIMLATPAVRCLGNLSLGTSDFCKLILNCAEFKNSVAAIMESSYGFLKKEMLWVLTNLMNYVDESEKVADWYWILEYTRPFLSPLSDGAVQALYFLCVLMKTKKDFGVAFKESELIGSVTELRCCGKADIESAAQFFCAML